MGRKGFKILSQSANFLFVWEQDLALLPEVNPLIFSLNEMPLESYLSR